jgi:hypothetical protein
MPLKLCLGMEGTNFVRVIEVQINASSCLHQKIHTEISQISGSPRTQLFYSTELQNTKGPATNELYVYEFPQR